jgi:hypothetical protein
LSNEIVFRCSAWISWGSEAQPELTTAQLSALHNFSPFLMAAELIGLAASIISLIEFGGALLAAGYQFTNKVKKAPLELTRLLGEVAGLHALLDRVHNLAAETTDPNAITTLKLLKDHGVFDQYTTLLTAVRSSLQKCQAIDGEPTTSLAKRIKWPFKEKETKDLIEQLGRVRDALATAINVDSAWVIPVLSLALPEDPLMVDSAALKRLEGATSKIDEKLIEVT